MAKFQTAVSVVRLDKIRRLLRRENLTVADVAESLQLSAPLVTHYIRHLRDRGEIKIVGTQFVGRFNTPANLWAWADKPKAKPAPGKAKLINPPRRDVHTLTRWIGGNPFERLTA